MTANAQVRAELIPLPLPMQFIDRIQRPCSSGATPFVSAIAASNGDLAITTCVGRNVTINGVVINPGGIGDVTGPGSSTDNAAARFSGLTGKVIKNSVFIIDNSGNASTPGNLTTGNAGGVTGSLALSGATSGTVNLTVRAVAGSWTLTLPDNDGTPNQVLQTDGVGITSWTTVTSGVTCTGCTANTLPKSNGTNLTNSRITDNGTDITANSGVGIFWAGDPTNIANGSQLKINDPAKDVYLAADDTGSTASLRLTGGASPALTLATPSANLAINTAGEVVIGATAAKPLANGQVDLGTTSLGYKQIFIDATITPGGTTGNQTINKSAGSVNFAAAASSLVVTSNKVTTNSVLVCTVATNDVTLKSVQCVAAAGSFTIFGNAAATAETRINFWVLNQ